MPDGDCDPQPAKTSSFPGLPRSSELAHSPSLPRLSGTDCRYTFVPSSRLTVLKSRWSLSSSPLTAPNWYVLRHCMLSVWQVISHCVDARPCRPNDLSVVLRRVRNCRRIIIYYLLEHYSYVTMWTILGNTTLRCYWKNDLKRTLMHGIRQKIKLISNTHMKPY